MKACLFTPPESYFEELIVSECQENIVARCREWDHLTTLVSEKEARPALSRAPGTVYFTRELTRIADKAFASLRNICIVFETGSRLEYIGSEAFLSAGLKSIRLPANLKEICDGAFRDCVYLSNVTFEPDSQLVSIGIRAFARTKIRSIALPASLKSIGYDAFVGSQLERICVDERNRFFCTTGDFLLTADRKKLIICCSRQANVIVPETVVEIGTNMFISRLVEKVVIPKSVKSISHVSFLACQKLRELKCDRPDFIGQYCGAPFCGVFSFLRSKYGGGLVANGAVTVTCSGTGHKSAWKLLKPGWDNYWASSSRPFSWVMLTLECGLICPTHYSLRFSRYTFPKQWAVAGSDDRTSWIGIDSRHTSALKDKNGHTFACESGGFFFRHIRITQTGDSADNMLCLSEVELFGTVRFDSSEP